MTNPQSKVVILSGTIQTGDVVTALTDGSIVVLETLRTHAKEIVVAVNHSLGLDIMADGESGLTHLSVEVPNRGWSHFVFHPEFFEYHPELAQALLINAVKKWEDAGSPDKLILVM